MKCPKCKTPQNGYGGWCRACGHAGGNVRRAMLWTLIPTSIIAALLLARIGYAEVTRQGSSRNSYSNAIETQNASGRSAAFAKLIN